MISAGLLGGPGIGYKQDYFAVEQLTVLDSKTYDRYVSRDDKGQPATSGFPIATKLMPDKVPPVAGLDNSKLKVFDDYSADKKTTTLDADLAAVQKAKAAGSRNEEELEKSLNGLKKWWEEQGQKNFDTDKNKLDEARLFGAKHALLYTAAVPATLVIGFLLLMLYFAATGGSKQVHIGDEH